ncbi:hypothetical protein GQ55_1G443400 [Panicum hallii var. hallii]|uniref:AMP-dependent synthetase/ligase domain-containing protein n=1 Tax=Panicum hallii var. hallii TaxID=1504633 RepID=A0A2T7FE42_9POAL|nr:hypothetical protein GQ55_1G443400 [Panicum hallii var. hallii]
MEQLYPPPARATPVDVAAFVLSRLPHHPATAPAFVDAATGGTLSFSALRRAALSLASGLRLGLGLRRGDAVLVLSRNSLLLPQILLGVLAAGAVVVAADPDATPAEIAAAAHASGAVMIVAEPEAAGKVAGVGVPLLLTSQSLDPRTLSAEELIYGGDPTAAEPTTVEPSHDDRAFLAYSSPASRTTVAMTHADLVAAVAGVGLPPQDDERRVCLASLPMCSAHGLPLIALGLPAAGVTTVLVAPPSDPRAAREAVAAHGATDVVAAPEAAAALAGPMALDVGKLSSLRRVMVAPAPFTPEARQEFRRRLPWVDLTELSSGTPAASEQVRLGGGAAAALMLPQTDAAVIQHNSQPAEQMSATTDEANSPVPPLKKIQKIILGDIFSRSTASKNLRKHPVTGNRQAVSKL